MQSFPNLLMTEMAISGPLQCIVSDMTAFHVRGSYTTYQDQYNRMLPSVLQQFLHWLPFQNTFLS